MNGAMANAATGLPALAGVILGLKISLQGMDYGIIAAGLLLASFAALFLARATVARCPRFAAAILEIWILSAVSVSAFATAIIIWLSLSNPLNWIADSNILNVEQIKTVNAVLLGAISTYFAIAFTKDIGDAKGFFWTSTQFKKLVRYGFEKMIRKPPRESAAYAAIFDDAYIEGYGPVGWDFDGRRIRVKVLSNFIKAK